MRERVQAGWRVVAALLVGAVAAGSDRQELQAQTARPVSAKASMPGASVWLMVRPRVGDTLHVQMDQTVEISGRKSESPARQGPPLISGRQGSSAPRGPDYGPRRARANTRVTRLQLFAHSHVEASDLSATMLLATTDSMAFWAGTALDKGKPERVPLPAEGRQVRVRVAPDGTMRVNDASADAMELGATLVSMAGMLPDHAVSVGERWVRDIALPSVAVNGFRADGVVRAAFRLDSLSRSGRDAWISMTGTLERDGAVREMPAGTRVITAGTMSGVFVVDRQRAWIVDARTVIDAQSEVASGPAGPATPMLLEMRIEQRVRVR
ncbi:MAG: hypothetical protein V4617_16570 [Gemmatimonadota bacterium]